jgi:hypothetical protein
MTGPVSKGEPEQVNAMPGITSTTSTEPPLTTQNLPLQKEITRTRAAAKDTQLGYAYLGLSALTGALFIASCILGVNLHNIGGAVGAAIGAFTLGVISATILHKKNNALIDYHANPNNVVIPNNSDVLKLFGMILTAGVALVVTPGLMPDHIGDPLPEAPQFTDEEIHQQNQRDYNT